jgi:peptide/nickel transport system permease protein
MIAYVSKRLLALVGIAIFVTVLVFLATHALPGNVAVMILGDHAPPDQLEALELKLRLRDPLTIQYFRWAGAMLKGDLGQSLIMDRPIAPMVLQAFGKSLILAVSSMIVVTIVGILAGVVAAVNAGKPLDHILSVISYLGISVPEFFWAVIFIVIFAGFLGWLPASGSGDLSKGLLSFISFLVMPVLTLTLTLLAHVTRMTRSSMLEVLQTQYIKAARARGIPEALVLRRHALRNALLPTITVLASDFGFLIGGIVVVETVFAYPGIGRLLVFSIEHHDLPLVEAIVIILTILYSLTNLTADLLYAYFNPRIRYGRADS